MEELTIKITNGELKVEHYNFLGGVDFGTIGTDTTCIMTTPQPVQCLVEPILEELSIIGTAFKKAHENAMNRLIAEEQENITYQKTTDGICDCGHSDKDHPMIRTAGQKGMVDRCDLCQCIQYEYCGDQHNAK